MIRDVDSVVLGTMLQDDPDAGPLQRPASPAPDGVTLVDTPAASTFTRADYLDTYVATWEDGAVVWTDTQALADAIVAAVDKCYPDIDAVYAAAIGNRAVEYTDAETDARAFVAGGAPTENVTSFAKSNPTGTVQTNEWASALILARADAFKSAQIAMRSQRFDSQAAMRACTTPAELAHVVYLWDQFIAGLRAQLHL